MTYCHSRHLEHICLPYVIYSNFARIVDNINKGVGQKSWCHLMLSVPWTRGLQNFLSAKNCFWPLEKLELKTQQAKIKEEYIPCRWYLSQYWTKRVISYEIACILVQIFGDLTLQEAMTSVVWVLDLASNPHWQWHTNNEHHLW